VFGVPISGVVECSSELEVKMWILVDEQFTCSHMTVSVPGYLVHPINPDVLHTATLTNDEAIGLPNSTWFYKADVLDVLVNGIWEQIQGTDVPNTISLIPKFGKCNELPY